MDVFIPGEPAPQGSKRHVGGGRMIEQSAKVGPWREAVAWGTHRVSKGQLVDGPVMVQIVFYLRPPKSVRNPGETPHVKRPDVDKLIRSTLDGITGSVIDDDSQVWHVDASKRYTCKSATGARIVVWRGFTPDEQI